MKTLIIDSSNNKEIIVGLKIDNEKRFIKQKTDSRKAQMILPMIEKILKRQKIDIKEIDEINVNTGPGSFTGLRVGISIANALGTLLKIPVNGRKKLVSPSYK